MAKEKEQAPEPAWDPTRVGSANDPKATESARNFVNGPASVGGLAQKGANSFVKIPKNPTLPEGDLPPNMEGVHGTE